jgi:hypothetical protein
VREGRCAVEVLVGREEREHEEGRLFVGFSPLAVPVRMPRRRAKQTSVI